MFTGIVEELGVVKSARIFSRCGRLKIGAAQVTEDTKIGDSIAVNGVCLTVVEVSRSELSFDLVAETICRTNLAQLNRNDKVNLERAVKSDGRFSGHFVSGHIDAAGIIRKKSRKAEFLALEIDAPSEIMPYIIDKGSVAVDGVSLTAADIGRNSFTVFIIPHTRNMTTLGQKDSGKSVNIEADILGKHIHKFLAAKSNQGQKISKDFLQQAGFN